MFHTRINKTNAYTPVFIHSCPHAQNTGITVPVASFPQGHVGLAHNLNAIHVIERLIKSVCVCIMYASETRSLNAICLADKMGFGPQFRA
jgi:hypothetical protein